MRCLRLGTHPWLPLRLQSCGGKPLFPAGRSLQSLHLSSSSPPYFTPCVFNQLPCIQYVNGGWCHRPWGGPHKRGIQGKTLGPEGSSLC